jgi:hypothetical protein
MAISPSINFSTISSTRKAVKSSADAIKNTQSILFKRTKMRTVIFGRQTILKNRRMITVLENTTINSISLNTNDIFNNPNNDMFNNVNNDMF